MSASRWIVSHPTGTEPAIRLFCLPYSGGGASLFASWPMWLPPWIEVCALQLPGRENRAGEPPIADMAELVAALLAEIAPLRDRPYAIFGQSLGALVGFELVRETLRTSAPLPSSLLVASWMPPHLPIPIPRRRELSIEQFVTFLQQFSNLPSQLVNNRAFVAKILPMLRADYTLIENYVFREAAPLACPIVAFGGRTDALLPPETLAAWGRHTAGAFTNTQFEGGHFFVQEDPGTVLLALTRHLEALASGAGRDLAIER